MRKASLARLLARRVDGIFLSDFEQGKIGPDLFRHACLMGLEGLLSKHRENTYRAGRFLHGIKVKNRQHPAGSRVLDQLRNSALELVRDAAKSRMLPVLHFDPVVAAAWLSAEQERNSPARSSTNTKSPAKTPGGYSKYNLVIDQPERTQYVPRSAVQ
jgi:hypothetical protein